MPLVAERLCQFRGTWRSESLQRRAHRALVDGRCDIDPEIPAYEGKPIQARVEANRGGGTRNRYVADLTMVLAQQRISGTYMQDLRHGIPSHWSNGDRSAFRAILYASDRRPLAIRTLV